MDYDRLMHGAYWLRLAEMQAMPEQDSTELFHLLLRALAHLAYTELSPEMLTMAFELHYMRILGISPRMDECVRCGKQVDSAAWFDAQGGGAACETCKRALPEITNGARRIMLRTPMVRFDNAAKLEGHADLEEAQKYTRLFLGSRVDLHSAGAPEMLI